MKSVQYGLFAVLSLFSVAASADGGGTVYRNGVATTLSSAYAYATTDLFDKSKPAVVVVLSSGPIDGPAIDASPDRAKAFDTIFWDTTSKATSVKLTISAGQDARVEQVNLAVLEGEGLHSSGSMGKDFYKLELKVNDGKRIEGSFRSTHESEKTEPHGAYYDVHFASNVVDGPAFGPGLPPDGGEPFKGFREYSGALTHAWVFHDKEDMTRLANTLSDARLKQLNVALKSAKGDEDKIKKIISDMLDEIPDSFRFGSGTIKGDTATMEIKGKVRTRGEDTTPAADISISVVMKKENGDWCFDGNRKADAGKSKPAHAAGKPAAGH